jgi:hypothetical protein
VDVQPLTTEYLHDAASLLAKRHMRERSVEPLLPVVDDYRGQIEHDLDQDGAVGGSPFEAATWSRTWWDPRIRTASSAWTSPAVRLRSLKGIATSTRSWRPSGSPPAGTDTQSSFHARVRRVPRRPRSTLGSGGSSETPRTTG